MIKAPITKTGEIRYFEFIKIFLLVSFFYSFFSLFASQPHLSLENASVFTINIILYLFVIVLLVAVVFETLELIDLVKSFIVKRIPLYISFILEFKTIITYKISTIFSTVDNNLYNKLCVIRC